MQSCEKKSFATTTVPVTLDGTGVWGDWTNKTFIPTEPSMLYFVLHDCDIALQNFSHRISVEFRALQSNGSQFSIEMQGMLLVNFLCLALVAVHTLHVLTLTRAFFRSADSVHPVIWVLLVAMAIQYVGHAAHTFHLWRYWYDGVGVKVLEVASELLFALSQVMLSTLLIIIALGYTLLQSNIGELDLMIPVGFMVAVVHLILVGLGKVKDDSAYKFHDNEGPVGWILLILRVLLYFWFRWAINATAREGGGRLGRFCGEFRTAGTVYFLMFPVVFLATMLFKQHWRYAVMATCMMVKQVGCNIWLGHLFLKRGSYYSVSTLGSSFLPGGTKFGIVKEE